MSDNISFSSNRSTIHKYKIVLVGDQNAGKSSIIARYIRNQFDQSKNPTIGIDFISKNINNNGKMVRLQLWDTAGQERFKSLIPSYLKDAHMALVVFDLSNVTSAEGVAKWIDFVHQAGNKDIKLYIIGNKADLQSQIEANTRRIVQELAQKQGNDYREVSAKTSLHIQDVFSSIINDLLNTANKKKEIPSTSGSIAERANQKIDKKPVQTLKLSSTQSNGVKTNRVGCCQK